MVEKVYQKRVEPKMKIKNLVNKKKKKKNKNNLNEKFLLTKI